MGFDMVEVTKLSGDGGIDVRGTLVAHEQGLIITTRDFRPGAVKEAAQADKTPIALMNGEQLVMLLMERGFGVHRFTPDLFEIDEEFAG
jgi:restriction system protein